MSMDDFVGGGGGGGFVGVHIGAGSHSVGRTDAYLAICSAACRKGIEVLKRCNVDTKDESKRVVEAAVAATCALEDSPDTNAGYGSNLTEDGHIEMDASIMEGSKSLFGSVGAVPNVRNPIKIAAKLLDEQRQGLLPLGRVPPATLVGRGATQWANKRGIEVVDLESSLMSPKSLKLYSHYKRRLDALHPSCHSKALLRSNKRAREEEDDGVKDTVGVIVVDDRGNVASTVSSGGIALKQSGRVGQAALFGCGCWSHSSAGVGVAVSTTGCGEHLVRTYLAKECADALAFNTLPIHNQRDEEALSLKETSITALRNTMEHKFVHSRLLRTVEEKLGGVIGVRIEEESNTGVFLWTHTTPSMGLAFQSSSQNEPTTVMSRLNKSNSNKMIVEGVVFNI